jgi:hypothetical protein
MAQTEPRVQPDILELRVRRGRRALLLILVRPAALDRLVGRAPRDLRAAQVQPANMDRQAILGLGASLELESPDQLVALVRQVPQGLQEDLVMSGRLV